MALESLPKIAPALFSADQDLIQIYNKKSDTVGTINASYIGGSTPPSGVSGAIQFSNGSAFASDASNLFWDNTNKRLGVGTNAPTRTTTIQGILGLNDSTGAEQMYILPSTTGVDMRAGNAFRFDVRTGVGTTTSYLVTSLFGIGTNSPTAKTHIVGSGSTSATTSFLVQNSNGQNNFKITDSGSLITATNMTISYTGGASSKNIFYNDSASGWGGFIFNSSLTYSGNVNELLVIATTKNAFKNPLAIGVALDPNDNLPLMSNSAILQADSTTRGFLKPRMTDAQIRAIASPAIGLEAFNTDLDCPVFYSSAGWRKVSHSAM